MEMQYRNNGRTGLTQMVLKVKDSTVYNEWSTSHRRESIVFYTVCVALTCNTTGTYERLSFELDTKTGELNSNRVSGVLIGSANGQRTCASSYWNLKHVHLTSYFDFNLSSKQDSLHS